MSDTVKAIITAIQNRLDHKFVIHNPKSPWNYIIENRCGPPIMTVHFTSTLISLSIPFVRPYQHVLAWDNTYASETCDIDLCDPRAMALVFDIIDRGVRVIDEVHRIKGWDQINGEYGLP